jgi:hypothetical protein
MAQAYRRVAILESSVSGLRESVVFATQTAGVWKT